ncbi:hypothetical protein DQT32_04300 [Salmonella enterica subsp. enterica serovar Braenderup]|nr:hypothetical protein [Salmonella enterica subsp. enterica serovar Braenderup]
MRRSVQRKLNENENHFDIWLLFRTLWVKEFRLHVKHYTGTANIVQVLFNEKQKIIRIFYVYIRKEFKRRFAVLERIRDRIPAYNEGKQGTKLF